MGELLEGYLEFGDCTSRGTRRRAVVLKSIPPVIGALVHSVWSSSNVDATLGECIARSRIIRDDVADQVEREPSQSCAGSSVVLRAT